MHRRTRLRILLALVLLAGSVFGGRAVMADPADRSDLMTDGAPTRNTLITVQSYQWFDHNNGQAFIVTPTGERVWTFDPPDSRVFDAEILTDGHVLVSMATYVPAAECPPAFQNTDRGADHCVHNRVVEVDRDGNRIVWEYDWYDAFIHWHEVHDADRLPSGETAIIDMGNDRAFTVNRAGEITWEWRAREHIGPGSDFWDEYVPAGEREAFRPTGPESDWTHMNDIDALADGTFQLSIRNFDVVIVVDPETNTIESVTGRPGADGVLSEQHDPNRIESADTLLVADSENDRVVEYALGSEEMVWQYRGVDDPVQWPRDADRLPNGHTLVADSRNFRVLELDADGDVVWEHSLAEERGIVYDVDRVGLPEEPDDVPGGRALESRGGRGPLGAASATVESWAQFVFPPWVGLLDLVVLLVGIIAAVVLLVDLLTNGVPARWGRRGAR